MRNVIRLAVALFALLPGAGLAQVDISLSGATARASCGAHSGTLSKAEIPVDRLYVDAPDSQCVSVSLPFDTEYKINLKNNESRRALVNIRVDGRAATGEGLVLRSYERVDLERFIDNGDLRKGKRFKFVALDEELKKSRQASSDDGTIVVTVQYEKRSEPTVRYREPSRSTNVYSTTSEFLNNKSSTAYHADGTATVTSGIYSGVTVEGSDSRQRFETTKIDELENASTTITLKLSGYYPSAPLLLRQR